MKSILFVDDKPAIGKVLSVYLGEDNNLTYKQDAVKAIEWLNDGNIPHLIITDIHMPHMEGTEFLNFLKHDDRYKNIPVVMLSGEENSDVRIQTLENGAEDYIVKPFNPKELKARIKKFI